MEMEMEVWPLRTRIEFIWEISGVTFVAAPH